MKRVDVKIGFSCNNRCVFCIQGDKRFREPDLPFEEIKRRLEKGKKDGAESVVFTGGEPTFRPEMLLDLVRHAGNLGYVKIQIQSNGRMFSYPKYCRDLIKAGANEFSPAIHGSCAKVHDSLTMVPGSWEQTVRGIMNLKELGQYVMTNSVVVKGNFKDIPNLAKLLVKLNVDQFQFAFVHINEIIAADSKLIDKVVPRISEVAPYIQKGVKVGIDSGIKVMTEAVPYCFMQGYEGCIAENIIPEAHVFDGKLEIKDYTKYRWDKGKARGPQCEDCIHFGVCEGPWREYPEIFGWDEFIPVKK